MKTCSKTIKACGLKSTKQVAGLNDKSPRTIQLAFRDDYPRFVEYVLSAVDSDAEWRRAKAEGVLKERYV